MKGAKKNFTQFGNLSWRNGRGFTLLENMIALSVISLLLAAVLLPLVGFAREKGRVARCVGNLQQIAHTMNMYKTYFLKYPVEPMGNFSPLNTMVLDINIFSCPSTLTEMESSADLDGKTSYRYFGTREDLKRKGLCSKGLCCKNDTHNSHAFDPAHPGKSWEERRRFGAVYDRDYDNHKDGCINIVFFDDSHWERLCSAKNCIDRTVEGIEGDATAIATATSTGATTSHVHVHSRGADAKITVSFTDTSVSVTSTKDLSNIVLEFIDGIHQKFEGLTGTTGTFSGEGRHRGKRVVGIWVKSGNNGSGDGPGYGEYFPTNAYGSQ